MARASFSTPRAPHRRPSRWWMVKVAFAAAFRALVPLELLKADPRFKGMPLLQRGQRLSVLPVEARHFELICELGQRG